MNLPASSTARTILALALYTVLPAHPLQAANYCLSLNGDHQYVTVPAEADFGLTSAATFEAWIYPTAAKCSTILCRGSGDGGVSTDYLLQVGWDGTNCGAMKIAFLGASQWNFSTGTIPLNAWTHVAVTYDGGVAQFYTNGALMSTNPCYGPLFVSATSPLYIGRQGDYCNCNFFEGLLMQVRIWNTVRTPSQIAADMGAYAPGPQPGLVAYYNLNEGRGTNAFDASGNGYTGTLTNGAGWTNTIPASPVLGTTSLVEGPAAGSDSVVLACSGTPWSATANAPWLHLSPANQSGTDSATVIFSFDANSGATRTGTLTIATQTLTVTQAGSTYQAVPPSPTLLNGFSAANSDLAIDNAGSLYAADLNNVINQWLPASNNVAALPISGLNHPCGVSLDRAGNLYIADSLNNAVKVWSPASGLTNLVSTGLNNPVDVDVDVAGNVYIADKNNNAIKQWSAASNIVTTLVGSGLNGPLGVAADAMGNVYIADALNNAVKQYSPLSGTVTTLTSFGSIHPSGVRVDGSGNVYVGDSSTGAIEEWLAVNNTVIPFAAAINFPSGIGVDAGANVYFTDSGIIEGVPRAFVDPTTRWEPLDAGTDALPVVLPANQNLLAPFAPVSNSPWLTLTGITNGVVSFAFAATPTNRLGFISVLGQSIPVQQFNFLLNTNLLTVGPAAGTNQVILSVSPAATQAWSATSQAPWLHLGATSGSGSATVSFTFDTNPGSARVGTLTIAGQTLTVVQQAVVLGTTALWEGSGGFMDMLLLGCLDSPWTATANAPWLHLSPENQSGIGSTNIVFSFDANTNATRTGTLTIAGQTVTVTQTSSSYALVSANLATTTLVSSGLNQPLGLAVDTVGDVYIADEGHNLIKKWLANSNTVVTLPISGLAAPSALALDAAGNLYIADRGHNAIKQWSPTDNTLTPLVTNQLNSPTGVALDPAGNVYIAESGQGVIKMWMPANSNLVTLFSSPSVAPEGIAVDATGIIYITDYGDNTVKTLQGTNLSIMGFPPLNAPFGICVDGSGNVFVADNVDNLVYEWQPLFMGVNPVSSGWSHPESVAVDALGNLYVGSADNTVKEVPRTFVYRNPKVESAGAGSDALPPVLPATQNLLPPFFPVSDQPWLTNISVANGVVSFAFTANNGPVRAGNLTVLGRKIHITQSGASMLINPTILPNGAFQFAFTNAAGASFTVCSTTNVALPLSQWLQIGSPTETSPGHYVFTDTPATNSQTFYTVRSP